jgi:hypothetical protein
LSRVNSSGSTVCEDGKKNPVVQVGAKGVVAVKLLVDTAARIVQFYAITSAVQGGGRKIIATVVGATPEDWHLAVPLDWSGGHKKSRIRHPEPPCHENFYARISLT